MGNVDLCFLTEAKLADGICTREAHGFEVVATKAMSPQRGGIALAYRKSPYWQVESTACHGPNVISCVLVSGTMRQPLIGVHIPPSDETTIGHLEKALDRFHPVGRTPIVLGDLNANLGNPLGARAQQIATLMATAGISSMTPHFRQRRCHRNGATWKQFSADGKELLNQSWCDYYLLASDRRHLTSVLLKSPPNFLSDHSMVVGQLLSKSFRANRRYLKRRQRFPLQAPNVGPTSPLPDRLFSELKEASAKARSETRSRQA